MKKEVTLITIALTIAIFYLISLLLAKNRFIKDPTDIDPMVKMVNSERKANGVSELSENILLDESATMKACDMRDKNYFAHTAPYGKTPWAFFKEAGYNFQLAGENMDKGFFNDTDRMNAFMASPLHKENILNPDYKEIGIGRCGIYLVQHFGTEV